MSTRQERARRSIAPTMASQLHDRALGSMGLRAANATAGPLASPTMAGLNRPASHATGKEPVEGRVSKCIYRGPHRFAIQVIEWH